MKNYKYIRKSDHNLLLNFYSKAQSLAIILFYGSYG